MNKILVGIVISLLTISTIAHAKGQVCHKKGRKAEMAQTHQHQQQQTQARTQAQVQSQKGKKSIANDDIDA